MYKRTIIACYAANISMSAVSILPALLFLTFKNLYGISFSLLGFLIVLNFTTQLVIDLIFTLFADRLPLEKLVKGIPFLTIVGFLIYAFAPFIFSFNIYLGLIIGTVIFSSAAALAEVLISPVITAIDNSEKALSALHSSYAWGVVAITIITTVIFNFIPQEMWYILFCLVSIVPLISIIYFYKSKFPILAVNNEKNMFRIFKDKTMLFCFFMILVGGASENILAQWSSSYMENVLGLDKMFGDILAVSTFFVMLGLGRTYYSKRGKNIASFMFFCSIGAIFCYLVIILSSSEILTIMALAFAGFFVSMFWPGTLIYASKNIKNGGVAMFALLAGGGDLGAALGPQIVGLASDASAGNLRIGILSVIVFPISAMILYSIAKKNEKKKLN